MVFDELTNKRAVRAHWLLIDAYVCVVTQSPTPLYRAYCNALLFAHRSVRQKLNYVRSFQLRRSVHVYRRHMQRG